jgi:hypothetical protein
MQLFSADPTIALNFLKMFVLITKSWKNYPQKLLRIPRIHFFSLTAQTAQTEEFMFQNVAYWPTGTVPWDFYKYLGNWRKIVKGLALLSLH